MNKEKRFKLGQGCDVVGNGGWGVGTIHKYVEGGREGPGFASGAQKSASNLLTTDGLSVGKMRNQDSVFVDLTAFEFHLYRVL